MAFIKVYELYCIVEKTGGKNDAKRTHGTSSDEMIGKKILRKEALKSRRAISRKRNDELSSEVKSRLFKTPEFSRAKVIASYVAKSDEVHTRGIILAALEQGKRVIIPRADRTVRRLHFYEIHSLSGLTEGNFGVPEPPARGRAIPLSESQVVLVPVVAWDKDGNRLGYGKGYFDRELRSRGASLAIGLAFESQRAAKLPRYNTDIPLDAIVTEERVLRVKQSRRSKPV